MSSPVVSDPSGFRAFVHSLPKIELHAHLSGSVSVNTLAALDPQFLGPDYRPVEGDAERNAALVERMYKRPRHTADCFSYFGSCSRVIVNLDRLRLVTLSVLRDFAAENTAYLELRTTAKRFKREDGVGETEFHEYIQTVWNAVLEFEEAERERGAERDRVMVTRLLLSVDRGRVQTVEDALSQLRVVKDLAVRFRGFVVGIDVSGNPEADTMNTAVIPALLRFAEESTGAVGQPPENFFHEFPLTVHVAESRFHAEKPRERPEDFTRDQGDAADSESESTKIINLKTRLNIQRLGHVTYLSESDRARAKELGVCVELCPSSNRVTAGLKDDLSDHHFPCWWADAQKGGSKQKDVAAADIAICTDDRGLFSCSLTDELCSIAQAFGCTENDIRELQVQALRAAFLPKGQVRDTLEKLIGCR